MGLVHGVHHRGTALFKCSGASLSTEHNASKSKSKKFPGSVRLWVARDNTRVRLMFELGKQNRNTITVHAMICANAKG